MRLARRKAQGFVLASVLWVLAALAILAAYVDGLVAPEVERAALARHSLESELARRSTEATLVYLLATGRMNHRGLVWEEAQRFSDALAEGEYLPDDGDGELRLAGEVYRGLGGARFSLQDEGGLASVNAPGSPLFAALLAREGVARPDIERIVARVADYIDRDGDLTANGAEHDDYRRGGAPPPPNWIMSSPMELRRVARGRRDAHPRPVAPTVAAAHHATGVRLQFQHDATRSPGRRTRPRRAGDAARAR